MITVKAPLDFGKYLNKPSVFLAGTIDMGQSHDWQTELTQKLQDLDILILNPRRTDWDASWRQEASNPQFREQVEWEMASMDSVDLIVFYFAPGSKSPITLLELGLHAHTGKCVVCCPEGFWRKGNVDIVCQRYEVDQVDTLSGLETRIRDML